MRSPPFYSLLFCRTQLLLTTILSDTPSCTSSRLRASGWRAPIGFLLKRTPIPKRLVRRAIGVEPPYGPPFLRVLAAVASREWLSWVPSFGLPSILALPGTITFRPDRPSPSPPSPRASAPLSDVTASVIDTWLPGGSEVTGVYTYACQDAVHSDFYYIFRYQKAFWMRPASFALLQAIGSLLVKMLLMHAYASLFMLLSQGTCREAFLAELKRRVDRFRRWWKPRPPVRLIPIERGDLCAFCHEELANPPPGYEDEAEKDAERLAEIEAALNGERGHLARYMVLCALSARNFARRAKERCQQLHAAARPLLAKPFGGGGGGAAAVDDDAAADPGGAASSSDEQQQPPPHVLHCRWGCGKAVHKACAEAYPRNACVYCSAPMH